MKKIKSKTFLKLIFIIILIVSLLYNIKLDKIIQTQNEDIQVLNNEIIVLNDELINLENEIIELDKNFIDKVSNLTTEEMFLVGCEIYQLDFNLIYAIAIHETGWFTSDLFVKYNNPGGIRTGNGWVHYNSKFEGIISMCSLLKNYYINMELTTPELIGKKYCPDTASDWAFKVNQLMNELKKGR